MHFSLTEAGLGYLVLLEVCSGCAGWWPSWTLGPFDLLLFNMCIEGQYP